MQFSVFKRYRLDLHTRIRQRCTDPDSCLFQLLRHFQRQFPCQGTACRIAVFPRFIDRSFGNPCPAADFLRIREEEGDHRLRSLQPLFGRHPLRSDHFRFLEFPEDGIRCCSEADQRFFQYRNIDVFFRQMDGIVLGAAEHIQQQADHFFPVHPGSLLFLLFRRLTDRFRCFPAESPRLPPSWSDRLRSVPRSPLRSSP